MRQRAIEADSMPALDDALAVPPAARIPDWALWLTTRRGDNR